MNDDRGDKAFYRTCWTIGSGRTGTTYGIKIGSGDGIRGEAEGKLYLSRAMGGFSRRKRRSRESLGW